MFNDFIISILCVVEKSCNVIKSLVMSESGGLPFLLFFITNFAFAKPSSDELTHIINNV